MSAMTTDSVRLSRRQTSFKVRPIQVAVNPRIRTMSFGPSSLRRINKPARPEIPTLLETVTSNGRARLDVQTVKPCRGESAEDGTRRQSKRGSRQTNDGTVAQAGPGVHLRPKTAPTRTLQVPAIKARTMSFFDREWSPGQLLRNEWYPWHGHSVGGAGDSDNAGR